MNETTTNSGAGPTPAPGALVGPLPTVRFRDGARIVYTVPSGTFDPRWTACADHRVACDCREAELAETIDEYRAMLQGAKDAAATILDGHATFAYEDGPNGETREVGCRCTGCQIARAAYLISSIDGGPYGRDRTHGLSFEQIDWGQRWDVCTNRTQAEHPDVCVWAQSTRQRDGFHEHLTQRGIPVRRFEDEECPF